MDGKSNPYQFVSDDDFYTAIEKLKFNADETCESSIYEKFGVTGEYLKSYLQTEGFSESNMGDFMRKIMG